MYVVSDEPETSCLVDVFHKDYRLEFFVFHRIQVRFKLDVVVGV